MEGLGFLVFVKFIEVIPSNKSHGQGGGIGKIVIGIVNQYW
jgi:hypothetical protein